MDKKNQFPKNEERNNGIEKEPKLFPTTILPNLSTRPNTTNIPPTPVTLNDSYNDKSNYIKKNYKGKSITKKTIDDEHFIFRSNDTEKTINDEHFVSQSNDTKKSIDDKLFVVQSNENSRDYPEVPLKSENLNSDDPRLNTLVKGSFSSSSNSSIFSCSSLKNKLEQIELHVDSSCCSDSDSDSEGCESEGEVENWLSEDELTFEQAQLAHEGKCEEVTPLMEEIRHLYDIMKNVNLFTNLSHSQLQNILLDFKPEKFHAGECIVRQGDVGNRFYMIAKGEAVVTRTIESENKVPTDIMVTRLYPGHYFGELAMIYNDRRTATVRAVGDVELMYLTRQDFHKAGQVHLSLMLKQVPILSQLNSRDQDIVLSRLQPVNFLPGELITKQNEDGDRFYMITWGEAVVTENTSGGGERELTRLYEGHVFGEMSLLHNAPRVANVRAVNSVKCLYLTKDDFQKSLQSESFQDFIRRTNIEKAKTRAIRSKKKSRLTSTLNSENASFSQSLSRYNVNEKNAVETHTLVKHRLANGQKVLNKYVIKRDIGKGTFGRVKLCQSVEDLQLYAVKIISKNRNRWMFNRSEERNEQLRREVAIMKKLHHKNVVPLHELIDDPSAHKVYLVQEFIDNGNLMENMKSNKPLSEKKARKYMKDLLYGMQYLHFQNIVHRDIKPENILVSSDDTLKIADFGAARILVTEAEKLTEVKGTPAFMAPEMFAIGPDYTGPPADVWSLGATLYMMVVGHPPWVADNEILLADKIQHDELQFPESSECIFLPHLRNLLQRMLTKDPTYRITLDEVMTHAWITKEGSEPMDLNLYKEMRSLTVTANESDNAICSIPERIDHSLRGQLEQAHDLVMKRKVNIDTKPVKIDTPLYNCKTNVVHQCSTSM